MSEQPEALRLADELLANHGPTDLDERVAAELRRLYAVNLELLEALRDLVDAMTGRLDGETIALHNALIVIAKAEAA